MSISVLSIVAVCMCILYIIFCIFWLCLLMFKVEHYKECFISFIFVLISGIWLNYIVDYYYKLTLITIILLLIYGFIIIEFAYKDYVKYNFLVTKTSIQESLNTLPSGVCFYDAFGKVILRNKKMVELCRLLMNEDILNGNIFWEFICSNKPLMNGQRMPHDTETIILLNDVYWLFTKSELNVNKETVLEIVATDISQLYQASASLLSENEKLRVMNSRLKKYSEDVDDVVRSEEILAAKISIHDEIGQALLTTKYLLSGNNTMSKRRVLNMWRHCILLLKHETKSVKEMNRYKQLEQAAKAIGMDLVISGQLPNDTRILRLFNMGARETLTNAKKHSNAKTLYVDISDTSYSYILTYFNDGNYPDKKIREGGGLSGLRAHVEKEGGTMTIQQEPEVKIIIEIFKNGGN